MKNKNRINTNRNMMYTQQLDHLPGGKSIEQLKNDIENLQGIKKYAIIVHDKDTNTQTGEPAEAHVHAMLQFKNDRSFKKVAEELCDMPQSIEKWDERVENGFSYLIHATTDSRHKHQYSVDEVIANFDYATLIQRIYRKYETRGNTASSKKLDGIIDSVALGSISLKDAKKLLTGKEYSSIRNSLDSAHSLFIERSADEFHLQMKESGETISVIWIFGKTGTGKTRLAKMIASKEGKYYKTSTTKDPFQYYQSEPTIILDELRPKNIPYSELLAMFDPFNNGDVVMSSRYYNKPLACNLFIVTSPFDPIEFYFGYGLNDIDNGEQLYRRLSEVWEMNYDFIYKMVYSRHDKKYIPCEVTPNNYSNRNKEAKTKDYFSQIPKT